MKNTLLITASIAALVAGIGMASAQGLNERRDAPAAATSEQKTPEGQTDHQKSTLPEKKMKPAPTAQAPETAKPAPTAQAPEKSEKMKPAPTAQAPEAAKPAPTAQAPEKSEKMKPAPTAQAPEKSDTDHRTVGQSPSQGAAPGAAAQKGSAQKGQDSFAAAPMSTEQNVKFRETLKGEKAERLTNVQFSISIGDAVPRSVHFYRLPARIVEYAPQYRDFDYILVGDDILIVDPGTHRIVAVIPA
jgi:outer membrane biosynthesis protein TonB